LSAKRIGPRLSFFFSAKKFYRALCTRRDTNEVERANILAPGLRRLPNDSRTPSSRLHRRLAPDDWLMESCIQLQQRNCSRFTRDFSRRSTDQTRKELEGEIGDGVKHGKTFPHRNLGGADMPAGLSIQFGFRTWCQNRSSQLALPEARFIGQLP